MAAGTYYEDLVIEHAPVHIVAADGAVLEGSGQRPVIEARQGSTGSTISGLTITGTAAETGGVMVTNGGGLSLENCTLLGCSGGTAGAMIVRNQSTASLIGCTFDGNTSSNGPGGLLVEHSEALVSGCEFRNNSGREGGALMVRNQAAPTIQDSAFVFNSAQQGGAVFLDGSSVALTGCIVSNNEASATGGGVYTRNNCTLSLDGTKVTNNLAPTGGGITLDNGVLDAVRSTLATNGESVFIVNTGSVFLNSSILWEDGAGTSIGTSTGNPFVAEADYSIVDSAAFEIEGTVLSANPRFKNAANGNHRLRNNSPGIDSGDPALGPDPDGSAPDMGSHPYQGT